MGGIEIELHKFLILALHGGDQLDALIVLSSLKEPPIPNDMRLDGPQSRASRWGGKEINPCMWSFINILCNTLRVNRKISRENLYGRQI
jgi:hypothetical protein